MSIDQGTETLTITKSERTWRTNIETPKGVPPTVQAYREVIGTDPAGNILSRDTSIRVDRTMLATIEAGDAVTLRNGKTITASEMAEAIPAFIDLWREHDLAAAASAKASQTE
jgi:hypothetical protein